MEEGEKGWVDEREMVKEREKYNKDRGEKKRTERCRGKDVCIDRDR